MSRAPTHPEEMECFRMPWPDGKFSPDKCYEYTYATRKSWEYIPELGRQDWRYFTNKGFTYAGKWLRSDRNGWGDGGDYWEVFHSNGDGETIVYWDYDATLCWRECRCYDDDDDIEVRTVTRSIMDEMITAIEETKNYGCLYPLMKTSEARVKRSGATARVGAMNQQNRLRMKTSEARVKRSGATARVGAMNQQNRIRMKTSEARVKRSGATARLRKDFLRGIDIPSAILQCKLEFIHRI
jgi:hypothetical protein